MSPDRYETLYEKWHAATEAMPAYSKTTAYTGLREFLEIAACGKDIVPLLRQKIKADAGMDFVLSLAVIKIMGWQFEEFPTTDMTQLRADVLKRLESTK